MTTPENKNELTNTEELAVEIAAIQPRLYGFILKRLADREQTLEVLQRTNLVLCRKASTFQHGSSFTAWAFTIAKFQVMAWRKSEGRSRLVFSDQVVDFMNREAEEESAAVDQRIPVLNGCLDKLRDSDRDLVQRRYRDGEPIEPIAAALSKSVDAVSMQLSRIRRQLADCVRIGLNQQAGYDI
ncbi:MAG: sigma-70 family RNA polymerase sigma factor [Pirellulaceae bacterium]